VMGTHNRLLRLQADFYLEVIAANPAGLPQRTRWFSMDDPKTKLRLSQGVHPLCWVLQVEDIHQARKNCSQRWWFGRRWPLACADSVARWKKSCPSAHPESCSVDTSGNYASPPLQHRAYSSEIGCSARGQHHPGQPCAMLSLEYPQRLSCSKVCALGRLYRASNSKNFSKKYWIL
jgi:hypothetical protein